MPRRIKVVTNRCIADCSQYITQQGARVDPVEYSHSNSPYDVIQSVVFYMSSQFMHEYK